MPGRFAPKSEEIVVDSGSENGSESSNGQSSPSPQMTSSLKRKSPTTTTTTTTTTTKSPAKRVRIASEQPVTQKPSKSSKKPAASSSESSSEVSSSSESEDGSPAPHDTNGASSAPDSPTRTVTSHPVASYQPPIGFVPLPSSTRPSPTETFKLLDTATLSSKQVWHITAPASLPITALTSLDLAHLNGRDAQVTHKGTSYAVTDGVTGTTALLLPSGSKYASLKGGFARVLHLQEVPGIKPEKAKDAQGKSLATIPKAKEVRQQPGGLRTRYWPPGFEPKLGEPRRDVDGDVQMGTQGAAPVGDDDSDSV